MSNLFAAAVVLLVSYFLGCIMTTSVSTAAATPV